MDFIKLAEIFEEKATSVGFGDDAAKELTMQGPFEKETKCTKCGGVADLAIVIKENFNPEQSVEDNQKHFVCRNEPKERPSREESWWPHDLCSFGIYFCRNKDCSGHATTLWNQG